LINQKKSGGYLVGGGSGKNKIFVKKLSVKNPGID
jgi:hypothetical protein